MQCGAVEAAVSQEAESLELDCPSASQAWGDFVTSFPVGLHSCLLLPKMMIEKMMTHLPEAGC